MDLFHHLLVPQLAIVLQLMVDIRLLHREILPLHLSLKMVWHLLMQLQEVVQQF